MNASRRWGKKLYKFAPWRMFYTADGIKIPASVFMLSSKLWPELKKRYNNADDDEAVEVLTDLENLVAEFYDRANVKRPEGTEEAVIEYAVNG